MKASNMNTVNTGHSSPTKKYRDPQEEDDTVTQLEQILNDEKKKSYNINTAEEYLDQMRIQTQTHDSHTIEANGQTGGANIVIKNKDFSAVRRGVDSQSPSRGTRNEIKDIVKTFDSTEIGVLLSQVEEEL